MRSLLQKGSKVVPQRLKTTAAASTAPKMMKATVEAYSEGPTTLVRQGAFKFIIDEPPKLGGKGLGPNPLTHLLGSLAACTSYTMEMVAKEMKIAKINRASWSATGSYDLRGVQGVGETDARFQSIELKGLVDTDASEEDLHKIQEQVEKKCIVAATLGASGMKMNFVLQKGNVEHDCKPACELHDLEKEKGATGKIDGNPGKEADSPQFTGTQGHSKASSRGFHTYSPLYWANGEDVAREHLGADQEPQIQKEQSEKGAPETAGGAYASRDSPKAQAAPPTEGKSDERLVKEQTAGATTKPEESARFQRSEEDTSKPPGFADRAEEAAHRGQSPLGQQPHGDE